ncbi:hypothetical protein G7067_06970 [Leucobacter insecticola]|uniref:Uncharacterized protein n=1 Tax=Leucobacter insecticola TaxID=2714934 RepID=A0A6G8FJI0_9MICO|nr:hypothetical protein [Leucobacter insecticola]QIM16222.1 hypothetical protein G7067_06970 [Leucobacter insecticola]
MDLVGEWVYENPAGDGAARISIERDGTFEITGWPNNLQVGESDKSFKEEDLDWNEPLSLSGKLLSGTKVANPFGGGVSFVLSKSEPQFDLFGHLWRSCKSVVFGCKEEIRFYLGPQDEGVSTASFFRETE